MKPLPQKRLLLQKKKLLLQKTMKGEVEKLREMVSTLLGHGMSTDASETPKVSGSKRLAPGRERKWRRKL